MNTFEVFNSGVFHLSVLFLIQVYVFLGGFTLLYFSLTKPVTFINASD